MQHKLTKGPLLNQEGELNEAGYAFSLVKEYSRKSIKKLKWRIKEWDYYYVGNKDYGVALTIADNSYMSLVSVSVLDFSTKKEFSKSIIHWFTHGKVGLPSTSVSGDVVYEKKNFSMAFYNEGEQKHLVCKMKGVDKGRNFECDIRLTRTNKGSMVIVTPFTKKGHFYYNQKINCLEASGYALLGETRLEFTNTESYGVLDWGRGIWTYKNTWYWSSMNGIFAGKRIGLNLGYGFGDTSKASENVFFYDDEVYKLNDVTFNIPQKVNGEYDYMAPWTMTSIDKKISLKFTPSYDRVFDTNALIIQSTGHQVFGSFSGYLYADKKKIEFEDIPGFAERVYNRW